MNSTTEQPNRHQRRKAHKNWLKIEVADMTDLASDLYKMIASEQRGDADGAILKRLRSVRQRDAFEQRKGQ